MFDYDEIFKPISFIFGIKEFFDDDTEKIIVKKEDLTEEQAKRLAEEYGMPWSQAGCSAIGNSTEASITGIPPTKEELNRRIAKAKKEYEKTR